jgi:hypothetical protein
MRVIKLGIKRPVTRGLLPDPGPRDEVRRGCWDIHHRVVDMDINGVYASLNFPSDVTHRGGSADRAGALLGEQLAARRPRRRPLPDQPPDRRPAAPRGPRQRIDPGGAGGLARDLPRLRDIVASEAGDTTAYSLANIQQRSSCFVGPGVPVYEGMIVGENRRAGDMNVNVVRGKKLTNIRAAGRDEKVVRRAREWKPSFVKAWIDAHLLRNRGADDADLRPRHEDARTVLVAGPALRAEPRAGLDHGLV